MIPVFGQEDWNEEFPVDDFDPLFKTGRIEMIVLQALLEQTSPVFKAGRIAMARRFAGNEALR